MVATGVGVLTIALAVYLQIRERRSWVKRLGWIALGGVIAQGLLGGLTVKMNLPLAVSAAHATLAQLFFLITVSLAVFTSRNWVTPESSVTENGAGISLRSLCVVTLVVILTQLVLGATLLLHPDNAENIRSRMEEAKEQRLATQPHGARSAGCFFKNAPASPVGTGKMIDDLGMKGTRRGGAIVSPKHANFIVTEGEDAKAEDALALAEEIRERVKREHGIDLEYEVELWSSK